MIEMVTNAALIITAILAMILVGSVIEREIARRRRIRYLKQIGLWKHLYPND